MVLQGTDGGRRTTCPKRECLWVIIVCDISYLFIIMCFRTDKQRTKYTGALCGLGWDAQSPDGEAVLPENDMEIAFDIKFDEEDIKLV